MTGSDIEWWLEGIWYDLTDMSSADVPTLVFKLFVLFVVAFFGWQFGRMVVGRLERRTAAPPLAVAGIS